jgi:aldose 1-epimerase
VAGQSVVIELAAGSARLAIDPARGGRLASLAIDGRELLLGPPDADDRSTGWGCFLMAPWPGRLADGRFDWRGRSIHVPLTHGRHAIHGLLWARPWTVGSTSTTAAVLSCELPRDEWPMGGRVVERVTLSDDALILEASVEADDAMPAALGWHPWFLRRGEVRVELHADAVLEVDDMIPTGRAQPPEGALDLGDGPDLGDRRIDDTYTGVRSPITIRWPDLELQMAFGPEFGSAVVYTPPDTFCVEPQTATPNALALPPAETAAAGIRILEPGEILSTRTTLSWR